MGARFLIPQSGLTAEPVSAFLKGRAMKMAYESDRIENEFRQMQMEELPKQAELNRQLQVDELQQQQQEFQAEQDRNRAKGLYTALIDATRSDDVLRAVNVISGGLGGPPVQGMAPEQARAEAQKMATGLAVQYGFEPPESTAPKYSIATITGPDGKSQRIRTNELTGETDVVYTGGVKPPSVSVNVSTAAEGEFGKKSGRLAAERLDSYRSGADEALQTIETLKPSMAFLDKGIISGFAADYRLGLARALNLVGANNEETIANTESFAANMGNEVGRIIKQFGSGTGLSDADREYATKIAAGEITLNEKSIRKVMGIREKQARWLIRRYKDERDRVKDKAGAEMYPEIEMPPELGGKEQTAINPKTGERLVRRNGKWVPLNE